MTVAEPVAPDGPAAMPMVSSGDMPGVSTLTMVREMWTYAAGARGRLLLASLMLTAEQCVFLLVPWLTAQAVDTLQRGEPGALRASLLWVGGVLCATLGTWALHGPARVIERAVSLHVRRALTDRLYARLNEAPLGWHGTHHPAELAHRLMQAAQALTNFTLSQFIYLQNAVKIAGPLIALWVVSHVIGATALVGIVVVAATIVAFDRALMRLADTENRAERAHAAALLDGLANITTVLSLRLQQSARRLLARRLDAIEPPLRRSMTLTQWKWCVVDGLDALLCWGLVVLYCWQHSGVAGLLPLGGVIMVHQYAQQAGGVFVSMATNLQSFARMRTDYASAAPIWSAPRERLPAPTGAPRPACRQFDLCALSYEQPVRAADSVDARTPARGGLHGLTLRLAAGERVALVGPSGSGKSTLLRLLAGLSEPTEGRIEIDGVRADAWRDLRRAATLIPQEAQVFAATLRENVGFDLGHSDAELLDAARIAALDSLIATLPQGLDAPIAQGGANLSGGQRQRLCLARGVLAAHGSSLLLLDEPTSALDQLTEANVYERLFDAFPEACIVASVHRMSLLERFDRVVLLVQGRIVDSGTAGELAARQPLFREMLGADADEVIETAA